MARYISINVLINPTPAYIRGPAYIRPSNLFDPAYKRGRLIFEARLINEEIR